MVASFIDRPVSSRPPLKPRSSSLQMPRAVSQECVRRREGSNVGRRGVSGRGGDGKAAGRRGTEGGEEGLLRRLDAEPTPGPDDARPRLSHDSGSAETRRTRPLSESLTIPALLPFSLFPQGVIGKGERALVCLFGSNVLGFPRTHGHTDWTRGSRTNGCSVF